MKKPNRIISVLILIIFMFVFAACQSPSVQQTKEQPTYEKAYAQALSLGYSGTLEEFINLLKGESGESAYEIAIKNGYTGTEAEWLATLKGKSAYEIAVQNGFEGTETDWLASLKGEQGPAGKPGLTGEPGLTGQEGVNGLSAYEIAVSEGFEGSASEWVDSLTSQGGGFSISDIINAHNLISSVVELTSIYAEDSALASGVIITEQGHILTNAHCVVYDFQDIQNPIMYESVHAKLRNDETEYEVEIIDHDITKDLAIVKFVNVPQNIIAATMGNSDNLKIGDTAIVIGNAVGLGITAASGIISEVASSYIVDYMGAGTVEAIRTDAAVNPGNSGGALYDENGQLIGIITFKISSENYENLGFALSINFAQSYIQSILGSFD